MRKNPSRFAKRMANRLSKAVGKANLNLKQRFSGLGVRECAKIAAAGQFSHFNRDLVRKAKSEEEAEYGRGLSLREHMLYRKRLRENGMLDGSTF